MLSHIIALLAGIFLCSTSVILIKANSVHPVLLSGYRLVIAAAILSPFFLRAYQAHKVSFPLKKFKSTLFPAVILAIHFMSWTVGARSTIAANGSLIVNLVPIAMPVVLYFTVREVVNRGEIGGTLLSLAGVFLLAGGDYVSSREYLTGDLVCFGSMVLFAIYLAQGKKNRDFPSIWLYLVPVYGVAGIICFGVGLMVTDPFVVLSGRDYLVLLGLGLIPTIGGHSLINNAMQHLRGQVVSVCNLGQFIFAGAMAYLFFGEVPATVFYVACLLIIGGAIITILSNPKTAVLRSPMSR